MSTIEVNLGVLVRLDTGPGAIQESSVIKSLYVDNYSSYILSSSVRILVVLEKGPVPLLPLSMSLTPATLKV